VFCVSRKLLQDRKKPLAKQKYVLKRVIKQDQGVNIPTWLETKNLENERRQAKKVGATKKSQRSGVHEGDSPEGEKNGERSKKGQDPRRPAVTSGVWGQTPLKAHGGFKARGGGGAPAQWTKRSVPRRSVPGERIDCVTHEVLRTQGVGEGKRKEEKYRGKNDHN